MTIGSVDGLISGMSTSSIIDQIMAMEARGQTALKARVNLHQRGITALQSINAKFASLATAAAALTAANAFAAKQATSSSDAVVVTASAGASAGSLTFDVTGLAAAEAHATTSSYALTDTLVSTGAVQITKGGTTVDIAVTDGSLKGVVDAINANPNAGVKAAAVQVSDGQYRLQLTSTTTGSASSFTVTGLDVAESVVTAAADATIWVGDATTGYTVSSASNTFKDVLPGVTFTAQRKQTAVTVEVKSDVAGISGKVEGLVKALNAALEDIATHTGINAADRTKSGVLAGDSLMRSMASNLLSSVSKGLPSGTLADVGIQTTRDGKITFDSAKFATAFEADPAKVEAMFGRRAEYLAGASTSVTVASIGGKTGEGDHDVVITQAATQASGSYSAMTAVAGTTYSVSLNGKTASYTAALGDGVAEVAAGLRASATTEGMAVTITDSVDRIDFAATAYGSASQLSVATALGATAASVAGVDVAGTIGGIQGAGSGQNLSTIGKTGLAADISLMVSVTAAEVSAAGGSLSAGKVHVEAGFAQRLETLSKVASDRYDGSITKVIESRQSAIKGFNDQIASWDVRLATRRAMIKRQFAGLEIALGRMRDQSNWLAGQIGSLPTG